MHQKCEIFKVLHCENAIFRFISGCKLRQRRLLEAKRSCGNIIEVRTILALMLPLHCSRVNTVVFCLHDQIRDDHLGVWLFTDTSTTKGGGGEEGAKLTC